MSKLLSGLHEVRRQLRYLAGYLDVVKSAPVPRLTDFGRCQKPVLLLHGFFATRRTLEVLERRLRRDGYCVFSLNLGGLARTLNTRGIDDSAEYVRAKVERIYERNPELGPLTIIGHSKGGLIAAWYVKKLGGWRRTRTVITLGTPHHGTRAAYAALPMGLLARSLWQMAPTSSFLRELQRGSWPPGVRLVSLYSREDKVSRYPSPLLETFGVPYLRNVEVQARGHREFLYKRRVYDVLLAELRAADAAARSTLSAAPVPRDTSAEPAAPLAPPVQRTA
jgi:triacylglycerol esterase/lipase EstA (alpha/beta hydrolase family)